jgi:dTMP kinase
MFITFEGPEGAGKTTQIAILTERLRGRGLSVVTTRQPGGDPLGQSLRALILDQSAIAVDPMAELFMMMADRAQSVVKVIQPALASGSTVICDRYADSSVAYQGYGHGIDLDTVRRLNEIATRALAPDLTILLDIDPKLGLDRQRQRNKMESMGYDFHCRVRGGFLDIARVQPERVRTVDASRTIEVVAEDVWRAYEAYHRDRAQP